MTTRRGPARLHPLESRIRLVVAALVAALALVACGGGDTDDPGTDETTPTIELEPTTTTAPATPTPETEALDALLLTETLPGFTQDGGGPLDLDGAAATENDPDAERALLEARGFVAGVERLFRDDTGRVVYLSTYELRDAGSAAAYLADGNEAVLARGAVSFDVTAIDGAVGVTTVDPDGFTAHVVSYTQGARWFLVLVGAPDASLTVDDAISLATRQARAAG